MRHCVVGEQFAVVVLFGGDVKQLFVPPRSHRRIGDVGVDVARLLCPALCDQHIDIAVFEYRELLRDRYVETLAGGRGGRIGAPSRAVEILVGAQAIGRFVEFCPRNTQLRGVVTGSRTGSVDVIPVALLHHAVSPVDRAAVVVNLFDRPDAVIRHVDLHGVRAVEAEAPLPLAALVELRHEEMERIAVLESVAGPVPVDVLRSCGFEGRAERSGRLGRAAVIGSQVFAVGADVDERVVDHLVAEIAFSADDLAEETVAGHEERAAVVEYDRDRAVGARHAV